VEIITALAEVSFVTGRREDAISIMKKLAQNIRTHVFNTDEKSRSLTLILYNLERYLGQSGRNDEALAAINEALEVNATLTRREYRSDLLYAKAYTLHDLHGDLVIEECAELLYQSYFCALANDRQFYASFVKRRALEKFGVDIRVSR
jgi:tetratricopeptide (TPR) repeat protein